MPYKPEDKVRAKDNLTDAAGVTIPAGTPGVVKAVVQTDVYAVLFTSWPVNFICTGAQLLPDTSRAGLLVTAPLPAPTSAKPPTRKVTKKPARSRAAKPARKAAAKKAPKKKIKRNP